LFYRLPQFCQNAPVRVIQIKVADLYDFEGRTPVSNPDSDAISALAIKQFSFLPKPLTVLLEGDNVSISFPEESLAAQDEAVRLAKRASQRAGEGNYEKAIGIFKRVLELMPSLHLARHDLAMAYIETGDVDNAVNHLIEVLRLNPLDAGSWVVLANLYIRKKLDKETGEKFIRKALEISPANAWALNSLAGLSVERGEFSPAIELFEQAIAANPDFANSYYGLAIAHNKLGQKEEAIAALERLFRDAKIQDVRSKPVYDGARQMYAKLQAEMVERNESAVFKLVQDYKAEMEAFSGYPIRLQAGKLEAKIGANVQMAWKVNRDFHLLKVRDSFPKPLIGHLQSHELTHIKLESAARKLNRNKFFVTTSASREAALRSLGTDLRRWEKAGLTEPQIQQLTQDLINGLCQFLYNCPLDMIIERELFAQFPLMRPAQFVSSSIQAGESLQTNNHEEIRRFTPKKFLNASLALNGAYALFLEDLFHGASEFTAGYRREEAFALSQKIWKHWQSRSQHLTPGDEYNLVDEFADLVGVRDWYGWQEDPGHHEVTAAPLKEGTTNPKLLKSKNPAAVYFFLDAFKQFDALTPEQVSAVAQEIAVLGRNGLDYASPDEKYVLRSLPNRKFSGLHLMCLMFAGFKRVAPEHDLQMNLEEPFLAALEIYQERRGGQT
jgi:tetratricopeptide (TPR) repeat protein